MASTLTAGQLFSLDTLVTPTPQGIASRVLARTAAGNITLFAFDAGEELSEHTAPFDALVVVLDGEAEIDIAGSKFNVAQGETITLPANQPHAVTANNKFKMLLIMIRT